MARPQASAVINGFTNIWEEIFSSPIHLDSALSKRPKHIKSDLARAILPILRMPATLAQALGVGMLPGEPWSLVPEKLKTWSAARALAERLLEEDFSSVRERGGIPEDFPPAMMDEWTREWGIDLARELSHVLAAEPPLSLRATRSLGPEVVLRELGRPGAVSRISPVGVRLPEYAPVHGTDVFESGGFEIQDEGSQLMALFALQPEVYGEILQDKPGKSAGFMRLPEIPKGLPAWTVVDACAGAGGKSLAFSDLMEGRGRVYAYDTSETKLQSLRRRAKRAGHNNIQAVAVKDGAEDAVTGRFRRRAQRVLVDAPCTGWGVLRRNPDIKWRQEPASLTRLPGVQLRLLLAYAELVAPGGRLTYGVCTFRKAETRDVVEQFLKARPDFTAAEGGYLGPDPTDGFFMQSLVLKGKGDSG